MSSRLDEIQKNKNRAGRAKNGMAGLKGSAEAFINDVLHTVGLQRTASSLFSSSTATESDAHPLITDHSQTGPVVQVAQVGEGVLAFILIVVLCFLVSFGLNIFSAVKLNNFIANPASTGLLPKRKEALDLMAAAMALMYTPFVNIGLAGVFTHQVKTLVGK